MATRNLVPRATNEGQIGTSSKVWSQAHFTSGNFTSLNIYNLVKIKYTHIGYIK